MADVARGAELWGYVERVTNLGAYVNVGAEVPGFLLLKEIPGRPKVGRYRLFGFVAIGLFRNTVVMCFTRILLLSWDRIFRFRSAKS